MVPVGLIAGAPASFATGTWSAFVPGSEVTEIEVTETDVAGAVVALGVELALVVIVGALAVASTLVDSAVGVAVVECE